MNKSETAKIMILACSYGILEWFDAKKQNLLSKLALSLKIMDFSGEFRVKNWQILKCKICYFFHVSVIRDIIGTRWNAYFAWFRLIHSWSLGCHCDEWIKTFTNFVLELSKLTNEHEGK